MAIRETIRAWLRPAVVFCFGYDGFISYCRRDAAVYATALQTQLESVGLTICLDKQDLNPGAVLTDAMDGAIRRAPYFILLESPEAIRSRYVREELGAAVDTNRQIIRVAFPLIADSTPVRDYWLQPHARFLAQRIWLEEKDVEPLSGVPSRAVLADIVRTHLTRRKRWRFLQWAAGFATALLLAIAVIVVASVATQRANDAVDGFRNPAVSIDDAFKAADDVLGSRLFPMYDVFAGTQHWQLRNLENTTFVKPRSGIVKPIAPRAAALRVELVHDANTENNTGDTLQVTSSGKRGVFTIADLRNYQGSAASDTTVAVASTGGISFWRILPEQWEVTLEDLPRLRLANIYHGLAFSDDGDFLFVLNQVDGQSAVRLSVVSADGYELQSVPLPAAAKQDASAAQPCSTDSVTVIDRSLRICSSGSAFVFDVARLTRPRRYPLDRQSRNAGVGGGAFGPGNIVGYWTVGKAPMVYFCGDPCWVGISQQQVRDVRHTAPIEGLTIGPRQPDGRYRVTLTETVDPLDGSRILATAVDGTRIHVDVSGHVVVRYPNGATRAPYGEPFVRPGMRVTGAALTPSGSVAVVALATDRGSLLAVGTRSVWRDMTWHVLETPGSVLAVRISDDGTEVDALEHWNAALVTRTYSVSRNRHAHNRN